MYGYQNFKYNIFTIAKFTVIKYELLCVNIRKYIYNLHATNYTMLMKKSKIQ